jgi:hypothetical protein
MTGKQLRVLRALRRGPLYEGAFGLVLAMPAKDVRRQLRLLQKQGYVNGYFTSIAQAPSWELTDAGREIVEAMTP